METNEVAKAAFTWLDKGKLFLKAVVIFIMAFFLWIPTFFVREVIKERESRQREAIEEVGSKWAGRQTITGPILMIPYTITPSASGVEKKYAWFMADQLDISSSVAPQKRHRGIYDVVVYQGDISITAKFNDIKWQQLNTNAENILWSESKLFIQVSDLSHGINEEIFINWKDSNLLCQPWAEATAANIGDALYASVPLKPADASTQNIFTVKFSLHGSQQLMFAPAARETKIQMTGDWPDPSFTGIKIPEAPNTSDSGINVKWKYLNRTTPMVWNDQFIGLQQSAMGANLIIPVDGYDKTERSVKYALLCIVLTFAAFFLIETIYKRNLHLIQYGLAGFALVLFYTLLLSISEYTGFNLAYLIAAVATIGLVTWFMGSILKSGKLATFIGFVLAVVYGYIFTIIQLQDYALLMGSIGLFVALGTIMYFSRKLQW